jgi:uncharacterized membrane protein
MGKGGYTGPIFACYLERVGIAISAVLLITLKGWAFLFVTGNGGYPFLVVTRKGGYPFLVVQ